MKIISRHFKKNDTEHIHRTQHHQQQARTLAIQLHHEYGAPQHHPPMPPTKAAGRIKQNHRGYPTATPLSTLEYSGVVRFGWARERRHRLMGCMFWAEFGRGGVAPWPNRESRWADLIGPSIPAEKINHTTINRRWPLYVRRLAVGRNGGPVCGDGN
jgi:hypothetical protein